MLGLSEELEIVDEDRASSAAEDVSADGPAGAEHADPAPARSISSRTLVMSSVLAGLLVVAVVVAVVFGNSSSSPSATSNETTGTSVAAAGACGEPWPAAYKGAPTGIKTSPEARFYVWFDEFGFHMRGIDPAAAAVFKGQILVDTELPKAAAKVAPANAAVTTEVAGNVMSYSFKAGDAPSGFDLGICTPSQLSISVSNGTAPLPVGRIRIGVNRFAVSNPLVISRG